MISKIELDSALREIGSVYLIDLQRKLDAKLKEKTSKEEFMKKCLEQGSSEKACEEIWNDLQAGDLNPEIIRGIDGSSTVSIKGDSLFKFSRDKPNLLPEHPLYNIENKFSHKPQAFDSEGNPVSKYLFPTGEVVTFRDPHGTALYPGHGEEVEYTVKPRFKYGSDVKEKKYDLNQRYRYRKRLPWEE